jgi:hypothetical protein
MTDIEDNRRPVGRNAGAFDERPAAGERLWFRPLSVTGAAHVKHPEIGMIRGSSVDQSRSVRRQRKRPVGLETGDQSRGDCFPVFTSRLHENLVEGDGLVQPAKIVDSIPPGSPSRRRDFRLLRKKRLLAVSVRSDG